MKGVILCGGLGTPLREETEFRPKPMVDVRGPRFGMLELATEDRVARFTEKPKSDGWMSAGFFVLDRKVLDYLGGDDCVSEREPLEQLAAD